MNLRFRTANEMAPYRVTLHETAGDTFQLVFECMADDADHAAEQAENAYPGCCVLHCAVNEDAELVIYSGNEAAHNDGAGFWSNADGWVSRDSAMLFAARDCQRLCLPQALGEDARWLPAVSALAAVTA